MRKDFCQWRKRTGSKGVMTGCDENQEWFLKWWWDNYASCNAFPVTFLDFGMSASARKWCEKKGEVISIEFPWKEAFYKESFSKEQSTLWEKRYSSTIWNSRKGWLSKPLGLFQTPYTHTVWLDLDCQVLQSLEPLFRCTPPENGAAVVLDVKRAWKMANLLPGEKSYNTGVVSFLHSSRLVTKWGENTYARGFDFMGDGDLFNRTVFEEGFPVLELPSKFNRWSLDGKTKETVILHFVCTGGKHAILRSLGKPL